MIEAYLPRPDELWFRRKMLADEATMAYNGAYGGTVDFPEERWPDGTAAGSRTRRDGITAISARALPASLSGRSPITLTGKNISPT